MSARESTLPLNPAPAIRKGIVQRLRERSELEGVVITGHDVRIDDKDEVIMLLTHSDPSEWGMVGNMRRDHKITIKASLIVFITGDGEDTADAAMDRAFELLREVDQSFRGSTAGLVVQSPRGESRARIATVGAHDYDFGHENGRRWAQINFDILAEASTTRTG